MTLLLAGEVACGRYGISRPPRPQDGLPVAMTSDAPWWARLKRDPYERLLRTGKMASRLLMDHPFEPNRPTVAFIHGAAGTPADFAALAAALAGRANLTAFAYDDSQRLAPTAARLGAELRLVPGVLILVAHSMGALLAAYATSRDDQGLGCVSALYLNPLIGGSHYADDIPALRWLRPVKHFLQRTFFPANVRDLAPESDFEQAVFGAPARRAAIADRTWILFTERSGEEPDVKAERAPLFFGRSKSELVQRMGRVIAYDGRYGSDHEVPLKAPSLVAEHITSAIRSSPCRPQEEPFGERIS